MFLCYLLQMLWRAGPLPLLSKPLVRSLQTTALKSRIRSRMAPVQLLQWGWLASFSTSGSISCCLRLGHERALFPQEFAYRCVWGEQAGRGEGAAGRKPPCFVFCSHSRVSLAPAGHRGPVLEGVLELGGH